MLARLVLPVPGGPHSIKDGIPPTSRLCRSGVFSPITCSWPMKSEKSRGLILAAKGADLLKVLVIL